MIASAGRKLAGLAGFGGAAEDIGTAMRGNASRRRMFSMGAPGGATMPNPLPAH